jgi:hypothetical protein
MNDEVKLLFEMAYLPVAHSRNRYNGNDFLEVAVKLLDEIRKQTNSMEKIKQAAATMVHCFNDLLDPKLSYQECNDMTNLLVKNSPILDNFR